MTKQVLSLVTLKFICSLLKPSVIVIYILAGSLPACWATAVVTAAYPRDQGAVAGPAVGPRPSHVPVQPAVTRPLGQRAVRKPATRPTSKSIYSHRSKSVSAVL